jgi:hypothetical protein
MTKAQKQLIVIGVGLCLIVGSVGLRFLSKGGTNAKPTATPTGTSPALVTLKFPELSEETLAAQRAGAARPYRRDPFKLAMRTTQDKILATQDESDPLLGLVISAIVLREGIGMAMVNNRLIRQGDTLRGYQVVRIQRTGIVLKNNGEEVVLPYGN